MTFAIPNPILILILLLAAYETYRRWKARKAGRRRGRRRTTASSPRTALAILAVYLGLIVVCASGMALTFVERDIPT